MSKPNYLSFVNTLQGTQSHRDLSKGNTLPLVGAPWPMLQWSPQTYAGDDEHIEGWWFQYQAAEINGFRATRQPSPWMGDYGNFSIMPTTGPLATDKKGRESAYEVDASTFKPDYCKVELKKYNVTAEMTAADRCAVMRFTFNTGDTGRIVIDPGHVKFEGHVEIDGQTIRGYSTANHGGVPKGWKAFFVIKLDRAVTATGTFKNATEASKGEKSVTGTGLVGGYVEFAIGSKKSVEVLVGTSYISYEQAEQNLKLETVGGFDGVRSRTAAEWEKNLALIEISTKSDEQMRTFYSCFYRAMTFPHKMHEMNAKGEPYHLNVFTEGLGTTPGVIYTDVGFWDVYRTNFPFWSILFPTELGEFIEGFVQTYREGNWYPQWPSPGNRNGMIGSHIDAVIADAVVKNIKGFDVNKAWEGIRKNAFEIAPSAAVGRGDYEDYLKLGYVPVGDRAGYSVSCSLDYAYDDWCIAQVAKALGKNDEYETLMKKSKAYENLWDPEVGFFRPKNKDGSWYGTFDEFAWSVGYVEGGAWQCSWAVDHDVDGLAKLMGGKKAMSEKLDRMMGLPPTYRVGEYGGVIHEMTEMAVVPFGQYAHSNQPVHHVLYLFSKIGYPWKTEYWTRRVCRELYNSGPTGFCGDEDNGEMAAWYVLSAMGIYPSCVGEAFYTMTAPLFDSMTVHLPGNKTFVVKTTNNAEHHVYVQKRTLNGKAFEANRISHGEIVAGGELIVELGPRPMVR